MQMPLINSLSPYKHFVFSLCATQRWRSRSYDLPNKKKSQILPFCNLVPPVSQRPLLLWSCYFAWRVFLYWRCAPPILLVSLSYFKFFLFFYFFSLYFLCCRFGHYWAVSWICLHSPKLFIGTIIHIAPAIWRNIYFWPWPTFQGHYILSHFC